jgi:hypothetical protein
LQGSCGFGSPAHLAKLSILLTVPVRLRTRLDLVVSPGRTLANRATTAAFPIARLTTAGAAVLVAIGVVGWRYYASPLGERVRSELHPWLRPSGYVGQTAGILAFLCFVFIWLYPVRKKFRKLAFTGPVPRWLDLHVVAGLLIPLLVATHAAWRFSGLIGLGFAAIVMVCASGVVGRYLYVRIPRSKSGLQLTLDEVRAEQGGALAEIAAATGLDESAVRAALEPAPVPKGAGVLGALRQMVADDFARRSATRRLLEASRARSGKALDAGAIHRASRLARREMALAQQVRMLDTTHRIFKFWHAAHRPVAFTALLAVIIHVVVVVAMGATWFL